MTTAWKIEQQSDRVKISSLDPTTFTDRNLELLSNSNLVIDATSGLNVNGSVESQGSVQVLTDLTADANSLVVKSVSSRIGIGTTNPTSKLTVTGNTTSSGSISSVTLSGTVTTVSQPNITDVGTLSSLSVSGNTTVDTTISGNSLFVNSSSGFVGIRTSSPGYKLDTAGILNVTGTIYKNGSQYWGEKAGGYWTVQAGNVVADGYFVGIGTNSATSTNIVGTMKILGDVKVNSSIFKYSMVETSVATVDTTKMINLLDTDTLLTYELISVANSTENQGRRITLVNKNTANSTANVNVRQTVGGTIIANVVVGNSKSFVFYNNTWYQE
jgi:hypothetical protein